MDLKACNAFARKAEDNSATLYIASLYVGSGECHVVRKGAEAILVDAGCRFAKDGENDKRAALECLKELISNENGNSTLKLVHIY